jgi:hypothetical protein
MLFYSIPYSILLYSILFYSILFYSILFYSILFYSILFYSILFYSILFYSILFYSVPFHSILFYSPCFFCGGMGAFVYQCESSLHYMLCGHRDRWRPAGRQSWWGHWNSAILSCSLLTRTSGRQQISEKLRSTALGTGKGASSFVLMDYQGRSERTGPAFLRLEV